MSIFPPPSRRQFPYRLKPSWAMGRLEYDLFRYASLVRQDQHNTLVIRRREVPWT